MLDKIRKLNVNPEEIPIEKIKKFKERCKNLTDERYKPYTTYKIWDIVVVAFLATLANANDWEDIVEFANSKYRWLKTFLQLTGGIPTSITYERVFAIIKPKELENIINDFIKELIKVFTNERDILSVDGKVDRGSAREKTLYQEATKPLNVLNVYSHNKGCCIASEMISDKTNEIPNVPIILGRLNIKGTVVTWDALNTQKNNVASVIDGKGDYVVALKKNQESFYQDVIDYFDEETLDIIRAKEYGYLTYKEKSHSQIITYEYYQTEDIKWYYDYDSWKGLTSIGMVKKTMIKNNKKSVENRYYISSLNTDIMLFSDSVRRHWEVENKLHWQLDFTFKCDANTTANKQALFNLQLIKKLSLALLNKAKLNYKCSMKIIRYKLSLNFEKEFFNLLSIISK